MPVFHNPARVVVTEGGGDGLVAVASALLVAGAAVVTFVVENAVILAACAAAFVVIMGGVLCGMRWIARPHRALLASRQLRTREEITAAQARPLAAARARALPAPPKVVVAHVITAAPAVERNH